MFTKFSGPGSVLDYHIKNNQLFIECSLAKARIRVLANGAVHVQVLKPEEAFFEKTYAVVKDLDEQPISLTDQPKSFTVQAEAFDLVIHKDPFSLDFLSKSGAPILCDEKGLGIQWDGKGFTNYKHKQKGEKFIGLGGKAGPSDKTGKKYTCWNTDSFAFGEDSDPLYASIPFYMGIHKEKPYGIFLDNTSKSHFNFGVSNHRYSSFGAESGPLNYYFMYTGDVSGILRQYMEITGTAPMPPKWSLGFQQCRYSYYPQEDVLKLAQNFRDKKIPADVIYLDIHYMDQYKVFTWHKEFFREPEKLIQELEALGFKVVIILDPGIKVEKGYEVYESGLKEDVYVRYVDGQLMEGDVWPGTCHFPDFTRRETRDWWAAYVTEWRKQGIRGFWNDMNEPAVWGNAFPDCTLFDYDGLQATHLEAHNVYGMQMCRSTRDGSVAAEPEERPFLLTRAAFAGSQRHTAIWTGDNVSSPEHMILSARMVSNLGLGGMPFSGADVGGFVGECSAELYKSWISLGAFQPLFRSHTMINSRAAEPWSFGEEAEEIARNFINLRYRMLPYWYSLFDQYRQTGIPPVRSLMIDHWQHEEVYKSDYENQFLLGEHLMICPVRPGESMKKVYFPPGKWYNFYNDTILQGGTVQIIEIDPQVIPVFVREGAIITLHDQNIESTEEKPTGLEVHIYGLNTDSSFDLYDDDGISTAEISYQRNISILSDKNIVKFSGVNGDYSPSFSKVKMYLHGVDKAVKFSLNGKSIKTVKTNYRFVNPLSNFDPFENNNDVGKTIFGLTQIQFDAITQEILIESVIS